MTDIFLPPNKIEQKRLLEAFGDPIVFSIVKSTLRTLDKGEYHRSCEVLWFSLTRQMFNRYAAVDVYNQVETALEQAADKDYNWFKEKYPEGVTEETKIEYKPKPNGFGITAKITEKISILDIARQFGITVKGNKAICPFHADKDPSLTFNEAKGWFHCFGCQAKGNIIKFYAMLKELNPNFVYKKNEMYIVS